jgi:hypothetical protein
MLAAVKVIQSRYAAKNLMRLNSYRVKIPHYIRNDKRGFTLTAVMKREGFHAAPRASIASVPACDVLV